MGSAMVNLDCELEGTKGPATGWALERIAMVDSQVGGDLPQSRQHLLVVQGGGEAVLCLPAFPPCF